MSNWSLQERYLLLRQEIHFVPILPGIELKGEELKQSYFNLKTTLVLNTIAYLLLIPWPVCQHFQLFNLSLLSFQIVLRQDRNHNASNVNIVNIFDKMANNVNIGNKGNTVGYQPCKKKFNNVNLARVLSGLSTSHQRLQDKLSKCLIVRFNVLVLNCPLLTLGAKLSGCPTILSAVEKTRGRCLCYFQACCAIFLPVFTQVLFFCILL